MCFIRYKARNGLRGLWCSVACTLYKHPPVRYLDLVLVIQTSLHFSACLTEKRRYRVAFRNLIFRFGYRHRVSFYLY
jgi:hypothetical protein